MVNERGHSLSTARSIALAIAAISASLISLHMNGEEKTHLKLEFQSLRTPPMSPCPSLTFHFSEPIDGPSQQRSILLWIHLAIGENFTMLSGLRITSLGVYGKSSSQILVRRVVPIIARSKIREFLSFQIVQTKFSSGIGSCNHTANNQKEVSETRGCTRKFLIKFQLFQK